MLIKVYVAHPCQRLMNKPLDRQVPVKCLHCCVAGQWSIHNKVSYLHWLLEKAQTKWTMFTAEAAATDGDRYFSVWLTLNTNDFIAFCPMTGSSRSGDATVSEWCNINKSRWKSFNINCSEKTHVPLLQISSRTVALINQDGRSTQICSATDVDKI